MGEGNYSTYILLGGLVLLMFWMTSRTKKRQRAAEEFRDNLSVGQEVMTGSGLFGTIVAVDDERVTLRSGNGADASTSEWLRQAIAKVVEPVQTLDEDGRADASDEPVGDTDGPTERDIRGTAASDE
ncbi:preprotein translocase subunit YajC [Sanguibacter hominis ATCC BAA-789]|uniref:Preprotein translocase subunit YajC n=1 Tax=Sanguibacter hominis ATCC BAA-789 TaxID=1312740 RepID=A0A9X5FBP4_9MICO|nr:preprotein translocase subunit YajC [Sanguibacter hominis]NKX93390.1 preprotein translocase subunit YajC [Sanguibacter hominis ATCC BAA-789]